jgi:hypothetical protein
MPRIARPGVCSGRVGGHPFAASQPPEDHRMPLLSLVITLVVVGVLLWLVNTYIPMDGKIKQILNVVVVIAVVIWLLYAFGILSHSGEIQVPKLQ